MSKIAMGIGERLAARPDARGIEDLVARGTGDARDDDSVGDEEFERQRRYVGDEGVAASHALKRRHGGFWAIGRIERGQSASAKRGQELVRVIVENRVGADLEFHDLRPARLRRQEIQPPDTDRGGPQASNGITDASDQRGGVIRGDAIDRHV